MQQTRNASVYLSQQMYLCSDPFFSVAIYLKYSPQLLRETCVLSFERLLLRSEFCLGSRRQ